MSNLLSQGGFGCAYYPGLNCKDGKKKDNTKLVTKLVVLDFNAQNEIYIGSLIQKINEFLLYFLPTIGNCKVNIASVDEKLIEKCKIVKQYHNYEYLLLKIPYIKNIEFARLFERNYTNNKHILLIYMDSYIYLINSISHLINKNIVHFDIKIDNILYGNISNIPLLIDFGISIPISKISGKNINEYFYVYAPENDVWPLEVHVINFLLHKDDKLNDKNIIRIVDDIINNHRSLNNFSHEFRDQYKKMFYKFLKKYETFSQYEIINQFLKFYKTWDSYSLSVLYLRIFSHIFRNGYINNELIIRISQHLLINISPDPSKRYSIENSKSQFEKIYYSNESIQQYLHLISFVNE